MGLSSELFHIFFVVIKSWLFMEILILQQKNQIFCITWRMKFYVEIVEKSSMKKKNCLIRCQQSQITEMLYWGWESHSEIIHWKLFFPCKVENDKKWNFSTKDTKIWARFVYGCFGCWFFMFGFFSTILIYVDFLLPPMLIYS